jgi:hypothetical protein
MYYKFSRKDSESASQKKIAYNHRKILRKILEHT